jgi:glycosyltransferase involved in cell wall biosynthesis
MKLLICTQVVDKNDPALGFFCDWISQCAQHCDSVVVTCLREGEHAFAPNVQVVQLEPRGLGRLGKIISFIRTIVGHNADYTHVLVHMNPEYVVLGGWWWRMQGKKIGLWYMHKSVNLVLRMAALFANDIFTGSQESFRLHTKKLHVMGHGIALEQFSVPRTPRTHSLRIITVGRLSAAKGVMETLEALDILHVRGILFDWTVIGAPATAADEEYLVQFQQAVAKPAYSAHVHVLGGLPHSELPKHLAQADVFVNLSRTGSLDKAVLEAIVAGAVPVSSNEAFRSMLQGQGLWLQSLDPQKMAEAIIVASESDAQLLQEDVRAHHSLTSLIPRILDILQK